MLITFVYVIAALKNIVPRTERSLPTMSARLECRVTVCKANLLLHVN